MNDKLLERLAAKNGVDFTAPTMTTKEMEERIVELESALEMLLGGTVEDDEE